MFDINEPWLPDLGWVSEGQSCPDKLTDNVNRILFSGSVAALYHAAQMVPAELSEAPPGMLCCFSMGEFRFRWCHFGLLFEVCKSERGSAKATKNQEHAAGVLSAAARLLPGTSSKKRRIPHSYSHLSESIGAALHLRALTSYYRRRVPEELEAARNAAHEASDLLHILWGDAELMLEGLPKQFSNWPPPRRRSSDSQRTLGSSLGVYPPDFIFGPGEPVIALTEPSSVHPTASWRHGLPLAETLAQFAVWLTFVEVMVSAPSAGFSFTRVMDLATEDRCQLPEPVEVADGWSWPLEAQGLLHLGYFRVNGVPTGCLPLCNVWTIWSFCEANRWLTKKISLSLARMKEFLSKAAAVRSAAFQRK